jgi:fused signal recognition particle receptor
MVFWSKKTTDPSGQSDSKKSEQPQGLFGRLTGALTDRLKKTRDSLVGEIRAAIKAASVVSEADLDKIEEALITADLGPETTERLMERMREFEARGATGEELLAGFRRDLEEILKQDHLRPVQLLPESDQKTPRVVAVIGVNGSGKTTTIGKLSKYLTSNGSKVVLGAGDTFRAAAIDQLRLWAERTGSHFVGSKQGSDPASVAHQALTTAISAKADVVLLDTAGRLHTKSGLMDELKKVLKVADKVIPGAPHEVILVLDATTGQNMVIQAREFAKVCPLTGLVVTKLDGTAKGGALIALRSQMEVPVFKIGVGEGEEDLRDFSAGEFVAALFAGDSNP